MGAGASQVKLDLRLVASGFSHPVIIAFPSDSTGRLFVGELSGKIRIVEASGEVVQKEFLNLGQGGLGRCHSAQEQGLLSLAFHPDYAQNGRFFVYYVRVPDAATVLAEYSVSANPGVADPTETVLLVVPQPFFNHNGGHIAFGPDGFLYLSLGDGGYLYAQDPYDHGQDKNTLLGSILRIDINLGRPYEVPLDNPFVGQDGADEIWAFGFRNPWRMSFDRGAGSLFVGDVGYSDLEEIDLVERGGNYGWRRMEGTSCYPKYQLGCNPDGRLILPIAEYPHTLGLCVIGGYVYRGLLYPALYGLYLFADWFTGRVWTLERKPDRTWNREEAAKWTFQPVSMAEDQWGELYVADFLFGGIHQILGYSSADLNRDNRVDVTDLAELVRQTTGTLPPPGMDSADLNQDGSLDYLDVFQLLCDWRDP